MPGIGKKRLQQIIADWQTQKEVREILVGLQGIGLSMGFATRVYKHYGERDLEVATGNPYQLALDVTGVGFHTADRLAARLNLDPLSLTRLAAGLIHCIDEGSSEGHVFLPREQLLEATANLLQVPVSPLRRRAQPSGQGRPGGHSGGGRRPGSL